MAASSGKKSSSKKKSPARKKPSRKTAGPKKSRARAKAQPPSKKKPARKKPPSRPRRIAKAVARKAVRKRISGKGKKPKKQGPKTAARRPARSARPKKAARARTAAKKAPAKKLPKGSRARAMARKPPAAKKSPPKPKLNAEVLEMLSNARVRHVLVDMAGENALEIIRSFSTDLSDEDLAKKLKIKISDVRSTLNHLHNLGVVQYRRHKDSETGWFSYYWSLNVEKMKCWVEKQLSTSSLPDDFETSEYYFCNRCGPGAVYSFVSATDYSFRCPTCAAALAFLDEECMKEFFPFRNKPKGP